MAGGFISSETFSDSNDPNTTHNDGSVISSRLSAHLGELGQIGTEANVDLRDKNDFFEKLDRENLQLTPGNQAQVYQLNLRLPPRDIGFYGTVGRFNVSEAGGRFADGAEAGYRVNDFWKASVFGGLNPRTDDQTYVTFNSNATVMGAFATYQPSMSAFNRNTYWSGAVVSENTAGNFDRVYLYNNWIYSWSGANQIVALAFLDFVPRLEVQTALVSLHQDLGQLWSTDWGFTGVNVIEYSRRQGLLETLPSSAYQEGSVNFRRAIENGAFFDTNFVYGERSSDSLIRAEILAGPSFYQIVNEHFSLKTLVGARRNFISNDGYVRLGGSYFDRNWEIDLNFNYALSLQNDGPTLHQAIGEIAVMHYFSHALYASGSFETATDEIVSVWTGAFRISYLFGQSGIASMPSKAPPPAPPAPAGRL